MPLDSDDRFACSDHVVALEDPDHDHADEAQQCNPENDEATTVQHVTTAGAPGRSSPTSGSVLSLEDSGRDA